MQIHSGAESLGFASLHCNKPRRESYRWISNDVNGYITEIQHVGKLVGDIGMTIVVVVVAPDYEKKI